MPDTEKSTMRISYALAIYVILFILMMVAIAVSVMNVFQANTVNDDIGWAIRNGGYLLTQGFQYRLASSWVVAHPYLSTGPEWLADGFFYLLYAKTGWTGLVALVQLVLWGGLFWTYWRAKKSGSTFTILLALFVFMEGMSNFLVDRPQVFTYLFIVFYLWWRNGWGESVPLTQANEALRFLNSEWIWLIVMPLWASFHGGFALFYVLFVIDAFARRAYRSLWIVPVTMAEIVLVMPNHLYNLLYPFRWQLVPYDRYISEVMPMVFADSNAMLMIVLTGAAVVIWRSMKNVDRVVLILLGLFALHSARNLPFYTLWVLWFLPAFRFEDWLPTWATRLRRVAAWDRQSFMKTNRFIGWLMTGGTAAIIVLFPWIHPEVHAFQNSSVVDNAALHYLVNYAKVLDYIGYEPMQYSDELTLWGDHDYLESQQDVWAGIISPKTEPDLTMNVMRVDTGQLPLTKAWGYARMRYILVRNGSLVDNEVRLLPSVWVPEFHDAYATVYVRHPYAEKVRQAK